LSDTRLESSEEQLCAFNEPFNELNVKKSLTDQARSPKLTAKSCI
jgi:hypothetical protein